MLGWSGTKKRSRLTWLIVSKPNPLLQSRYDLGRGRRLANVLVDRCAVLKREVWPLLNAGRIAPVIDSTYPLADAAGAHRRMDGGEHIGKIVLTV